MLIRCVCIAVYFFISPLAFAETLKLKDQPSYLVGTYLSILEDEDGVYTFAEVAAGEYETRFESSERAKPGRGLTRSVYWVQWRYHNDTQLSQWYLEQYYPLIDQMDIYLKADSASAWEHYEGGDQHVFSQRAIKHRNLVFPLDIAPASSGEIIIRYETQGSMKFALRLWQAEAFQAHSHDGQIGWGLYYGIMGVMALYNLFIFFSVRDVSYLFYVGFILASGLFISALNGFAFEYLWPNATMWTNITVPFFGYLLCFFAAQFTQTFLLTEQHTPRLDRILGVTKWGSASLVLASFWIDYGLVVYLLGLLTMWMVSLLMLAGVMCQRAGYRAARFFLLAWIGFLCATLILSLDLFGVIPTNTFVTYGWQIGSTLEVVLLSLALADRINLLNEQLSRHGAELEDQNEALNRLDHSKDEFLTNTSHELKTPINGMIGIAESLRDGVSGPVTEKLKADLSIIISSGHRLANLINDILDFSKLKHQKIVLNQQPINIKSVVVTVVELCRPMLKEKQVQIVDHIPPNAPNVYADENRVEQIVQNLVNNAIKFTDYGQVVISYTSTTDWLYLSVLDTGIGIEEQHLSRIFKSFEQIDGSTERIYGGTGIGLSISKQLVELHGGTIEVSSDPGKGSCFTFSLPISLAQDVEAVRVEASIRATEDLGKAVVTPEALVAPAHSSTILVVDDEPTNRYVLDLQLKAHGYAVMEAESGEAALAVIQRGEPIDLIFLDVMMPKMSGYEVCRILRQEHSADMLPVIMLTAKNQVIDLVQGFQCGANDYLVKPFSKDEMLVRLRLHLQVKHLHQQKIEMEQDKAQMTNTMVAGIAHEINNPVGICLTASTQFANNTQQITHKLKQNTMKRSDLSKYMSGAETVTRVLHDNLQRTSDLIESFKMVSVDHSKKDYRSYDLIEYLRHVLLILHPQTNKHKVIFKNLCTEIQAQGYPDVFYQIFTNLILNACIHGLEGKQDGVIQITCDTQAEDVILLIQDNGQGMGEEQQQRLFEAFYTTRRGEGGTGLGMYIVFGLVKDVLRGQIECQSQLGRGTQFTLRFPIVVPKHEAEQAL